MVRINKGIEDPQCVSINNGIFICTKCAEIHKNLGVQISAIKYLSKDTIDENQILFFEKGGNNKFFTYMETYKLNSENLQTKYTSKAAYYYRSNVSLISLIKL